MYAHIVALLASPTLVVSQSYFANISSTNTCLKRSVLVYTSETSTYVVTDLGSTAFQTSSTFCANASVSTVFDTTTVYGLNATRATTLPASTITVYQSSVPSGAQTVADEGFEGGSETPFNSSTSGQVTAEVASSGPLSPYAGDSYLLITFGAANTAPVKRQASQGPVYNVTQVFSATAGTSHILSAFAATAPNGNSSPNCAITICGEGSCSAPSGLTSSYSRYSYTYDASTTNGNAVAIFAVQCSGAAYVALDDISIPSSEVSSGQTVTRTITQFVTQSQSPSRELVPFTTTRVLTTTTSISGSNVVLTTTVPTVIWSTITQSVVKPPQTLIQTQLVPITTTQVLTTTTSISGSNQILITTVPTVIWSTLTESILQPPSTLFQTITELVPITTSELIERTTTISGSERTITTAIPTIIWSTLTEVLTQPAVTQTQVVQITTSELIERTTTISGSNIVLTTAVPTIIYSTIENILTQQITLPQATFTPPAVTELHTLTQVVEITTSELVERTTTISGSDIIITTEVPTIIYSTIKSILTEYLTLPQATFTPPAITELQTLTQVVQITTSEIIERTTTISGSDIVITTEVPTIIYSTIENVITQIVTESFSIPRATFTPPAETISITLTLEPPTVTTILSITPPAVTETLTTTLPRQTLTPPAETLQLTETLPQATTLEISTLIETSTPPAVTEVQIVSITMTLPQATETLRMTETLPVETFTPPAATGTATLTLPRETVTLPPETRTDTTTTTSTSISRTTITSTSTISPSCSTIVNPANGAMYCVQTNAWIAPSTPTYANYFAASPDPYASCAFKCTGSCEYWAHNLFYTQGTSTYWFCIFGNGISYSASSFGPGSSTYLAGRHISPVPSSFSYPGPIPF